MAEMWSQMKRDHIWYIFADFTVCAYQPCDTWSAGAAAKFLFQVFKDDIVIHALRCVCVCDVYISVMRHCPRRSKRDPNDLCDAKYSSQPRAQVSNGYWRLMVALHASVCVCVCASACSLNRNIQPLMPRNSLLTGTVSMIHSLLWSKQHVGYCGAELGSVTVNCAAED